MNDTSLCRDTALGGMWCAPGDGRPVSHRSSDSARLSRFVGPKMSFPIVVTSCAGSRVYHHW